MQRDPEPKLFIQEVNTTASQFEIQKTFPTKSSFPLGYIWVAIFVTEVTKGHIKSITKKSQQGRGRKYYMRALDLLNTVFLCQCFLLPQAAGEAGKRGHLQPEPLQPLTEAQRAGSLALTSAVVKSASPDKSESLESKKGAYFIEKYHFANTIRSERYWEHQEEFYY